MTTERGPCTGWRGLLCWLKIQDEHDGTVSLTNLALWVCIVKFALLPTFGLADLAAFAGVLLSYAHKRVAKAKVTTDSSLATAANETAQAAATKVNTLAAEVKTWQGKLEALAGTLNLGAKR